jgi:hypothetical protein
MTEPDPSCRPSTAEALKSIHDYHDGSTHAQLKSPVLKHNHEQMTLSERFKRIKEANAQREARMKLLEVQLDRESAVSVN